MGDPVQGSYRIDERALYHSLSPGLVVTLGRPGNERVFSLNQPARIDLTFMGWETKPIDVRWDFSDNTIHRFRLKGPHGANIPQRKGSIPPLDNRTPLMQSLSEGSWGQTFDLAELFDLTKKGRYVFTYTYVPPQYKGPREPEQPILLWMWDGYRYSHEFEFLIQ